MSSTLNVQDNLYFKYVHYKYLLGITNISPFAREYSVGVLRELRIDGKVYLTKKVCVKSYVVYSTKQTCH